MIFLFLQQLYAVGTQKNRLNFLTPKTYVKTDG